MTEKPIIFSGPMVRAILRNEKTQTRRILKPQPSGPVDFAAILVGAVNKVQFHCVNTVHINDIPGKMPECWSEFAPLPYTIGDLLYVRETWNVFQMSRDGDMAWEFPKIPYSDPRQDLDARSRSVVQYAATDRLDDGERWRPSIHMPKWAARIWLRVTSVKVERLQDISEADAIAEGLASVSKDGKLFKWGIPDRDGLPGNDDFGWHWSDWEVDARKAYRRLWDQINDDRGCGWNANDWVAAITFERIER